MRCLNGKGGMWRYFSGRPKDRSQGKEQTSLSMASEKKGGSARRCWGCQAPSCSVVEWNVGHTGVCASPSLLGELRSSPKGALYYFPYFHNKILRQKQQGRKGLLCFTSGGVIMIREAWRQEQKVASSGQLAFTFYFVQGPS